MLITLWISVNLETRFGSNKISPQGSTFFRRFPQVIQFICDVEKKNLTFLTVYLLWIT